MGKEIFISRCIPHKNGINTEIEKCPVNSIEVGRDYVRKLGWKLISPNEPFENIEHIEIYDRESSAGEKGEARGGFIERYAR
jgi:hypothetical protein